MCNLAYLRKMFSKISGLWSSGSNNNNNQNIIEPIVQPIPPPGQPPVPTITVDQPADRQEEDMSTGTDRLVRQLRPPQYEGIFGQNAYDNRVRQDNMYNIEPIYVSEPLVAGDQQMQYRGSNLVPQIDTCHLTPQRGGPIITSTGTPLRPSTPEVPRSPMRPWIIKPPKFSGESGKLEEFLIQFDMCSEANEWTEFEKLRYLKTSIIGSATYILRREGTNIQKERYTFDSLISTLKAEYGSKLSSEQWLSKLMQLKQSSNQSVSEYKHEMMEIHARLSNDACTEFTRITLFIDGLYSGEIKMFIKERKPTTLQQAIDLAISKEQIMKEVRPTRERVKLAAIETSPPRSNHASPGKQMSNTEKYDQNYIELLQQSQQQLVGMVQDLREQLNNQAQSQPQPSGSQDVRQYLRQDQRDQQRGSRQNRGYSKRYQRGYRDYNRDYGRDRQYNPRVSPPYLKEELEIINSRRQSNVSPGKQNENAAKSKPEQRQSQE